MPPLRPHRRLKRLLVAASFVAGLAQAAATEPLVLIDPAVALTRVLADWRDASETAERTRAARGLLLSPSEAEGVAWIRGEGELSLQGGFHPNDFPFIRMRLGGPPDPDRSLSVAATPVEKEQVRQQPAPLAGGGEEMRFRLPPEGVLSRAKYDEKAIIASIDRSDGPLALDYVMADVVRTRALAEFDSAYAESYEVKSAHELLDAAQGLLWMKPKSGDAELSFEAPDLDARDWNAVELRLRLAGAKSPSAPVQLRFTNEAGESGECTFAVPADGHDHVVRIYFYKMPEWRGRIRSVSLLPFSSAEGDIRCAVDYVRLRFIPVPGAGNVDSGILRMGRNAGLWAEGARLLRNWRFVAGQSWRGNGVRFASSLGRSFKENNILWETDMPTWLWLEENKKEVPKVDGVASVEAAARRGFETLNETALMLRERDMTIDAVHFDGLLKRLLMPEAWPNTGRSTGGGFYEASGGDFEKAYALTARAVCEFFVLTRTDPASAVRQTEFFIQPNFHVWAWRYGAQDYERIFTTLPDPGNFRKMMEALARTDREYEAAGKYGGPSPLRGFGADWVFMNPQKRRLVSYEWFTTEVLGYEFCVANNGTLRGDSSEDRSRDSIEYLQQFRREGGRPMYFTPYYWMGSWRKDEEGKKPKIGLFPESEPGTFAWTVLQSAKLCLYLDANVAELPPLRQGKP